MCLVLGLLFLLLGLVCGMLIMPHVIGGGCPLPLLIACGGGRLASVCGCFRLLLLSCFCSLLLGGGRLASVGCCFLLLLLSIAWTCVRDVDYAACVYCLHFCFYCVGLCVGC